jgi:hypothetical protein
VKIHGAQFFILLSEDPRQKSLVTGDHSA